MKTDGKMEESFSKEKEFFLSFAGAPLHFWERFKDCACTEKKLQKCW